MNLKSWIEAVKHPFRTVYRVINEFLGDDGPFIAAGIAFYAFFSIDGVEDTRQAAFRIVDEANVGLAPGTAFGAVGPQFLRACFHRRLDEVEIAADRLADWIGAA